MRPTVAEIDLSALAYNLQQIKRRVAPTRIMAVVKANAYGHGAYEVARTALQNGADYLGVALIEEGIELRERGIEAPILVFGGAFPEQVPEFVRNRLELTVYSLDLARAIHHEALRSGKPIPVHVKVDTGMGRLGVRWEDAPNFVQTLLALNGLKLRGVYSHFATSDERDKDFARLQLKRFKEVIDKIESRGFRIPLKHMANSGAILDLPNSYFDMVRPGISLYGYYPSEETSESVPLKPVMTLKSKVVFLKEVEPGTPISYGREYTAPQKTVIATVPLGYADGYNRLLTNQGEVLIRGRRFPIVGRVTMDHIMVDVGVESGIKVGDDVVLFGRQGEAQLSVYELCRKLNTIPYEVCCWVSARVPRVYLHRTERTK